MAKLTPWSVPEVPNWRDYILIPIGIILAQVGGVPSQMSLAQQWALCGPCHVQLTP